jgi:DNA-binding NtrC family response regulator
MERKLILATLDQTSGNRTHAAKLLGISLRTLRNKLREYRVEEEVTVGSTAGCPPQSKTAHGTGS